MTVGADNEWVVAVLCDVNIVKVSGGSGNVVEAQGSQGKLLEEVT